MKKFILLLLLTSFCFGQNEKPFKGIVCAGTIETKTNEPLIVLNDKVISMEAFMSIDPEKVKEITTLKGIKATAIYGTRAKHGVLILKTADYITSGNEDLEYNLVVTEPGFDSFWAQQESAGTYSLEFLKSRNHMYVKSWNQKVGTGNPDIFDVRIDYSSNTAYDLALEYKLYQFFRFIEHKYKLRLI